MAISYDQRKQQYESFDDTQKQKRGDMVNNSKDGSTMKQYMQQYNNEMNNNQQQTSNESNFNNQNGTNGQNQTQTPTNPISQQPVDMTAEEYRKSQNNNQNFNVSPDLDQSKFQQDPGKITVQEGTAQQTGRPDYGISTDARLNEMKGNLDHYFATSPRMFSDRDTFNRVFDYNNRESDAQKQLLDSYWKRKEDMDKASQYTSGESIMNGLKNSQITTDQLNLIKENDPEAYRKWQQLQEEEIKKRIVNDIVPPLMSDIANQINDMINNLGIQAQDALDIEGIYNDTMDRTGAYQTLEDCNRTVKQIEEITNKKTAIMNRYAASTGGTVSDALAAARMQKAIAPYNEQLQGLQYQYQDYSNLYSQKTATALQAANVRALQANENQRIWNQKCQALGFAMDAMSYRTPEQEKQLALQYQQAQNEMELLQESRLKDLARYDAYATAKLNNQLQQELTDLSVEDENQLKANLNNALSDYYKSYGDIIQRSQAQAVEDIIKYAKDHNMSVAQAMTENFIKPLQNKAEYKQKVAKDYGMLSQQSIATVNGRQVIMTTNPNGTISYRYIDEPEAYEKGAAKDYNIVDSRAFTADPVSTGYEGKTLYDFISDPKNKEGKSGGQCGKFVNDYLQSIGVTGANNRYYDDNLSTKLNSVNTDIPTVGSVAVFDYNHKSSDGINHGHVAIVTKVYNDGSYDVIDSNYDVNHPGKITKRHISAGTPSCKGFFDPSQPPSLTNNAGNLTANEQLEAAVMLEQIRTGHITDSDTSKAREKLIERGYGDQMIDAFSEGLKVSLSDKQQSVYKFAVDNFNKNDIVQNFEAAYEQLGTLLVALEDGSGAGDMSAIFTFMKTLDPRSVVRGEEFQAAATAGGALNPEALRQNLVQHNWDGSYLTPELREDYKRVAVGLVKSKAKLYQAKYNDFLKALKNGGIDEERANATTNFADLFIEELEGAAGATGPDDALYDIYSSAMNDNNYGYNNLSYGGYETSYLDLLINSKL